jgi:hypothetical protein
MSSMTLFAGAAAVGLLGGWLLARRWDSAHRRDLFSTRTHRRIAALGWLEAELDPRALPLLQDYLAWEQVSSLQSRARRLVSRLSAVAA